MLIANNYLLRGRDGERGREKGEKKTEGKREKGRRFNAKLFLSTLIYTDCSRLRNFCENGLR